MDDLEYDSDDELVEFLGRQAARARFECFVLPQVVDYGLAAFEIYLTKWAAFRVWEAAHPTIPKEEVACAS